MPDKPLHIVMLIDAWFPKDELSPGVWGGKQVHVRELRERLTTEYGCAVELFYAAHKNFIIRSLWALWVVLDVVLYNRYHDPVKLIHSHGFYAGLAGKLISKILKIPVIHTVHGTPALDQGKKSPQAWIEAMLLTKIKYNAQISVSSHFLKYENVNQNIRVIPNGVNISDFNRVHVTKFKDPTVIWVGRDDPAKGLDFLKAALVKIRKNLPNLKAELVSGGRLSDIELIKAYKKSTFFCLPSLADAQPISLLEAWAARLPVVVTRVGENATMVQDGVNGYLVDPGNAQQLAGAIKKILKNPSGASLMGLAGYQLVKKQYSWKSVTEKTYTLYQQVLDETKVLSELRIPQKLESFS
jgi:glycosyltransferase involved in cell wall biosynthesis